MEGRGGLYSHTRNGTLVFASFAKHFMDIPIRYGIPLDLGILEGIAAAAQWEVRGIDDHLVSSTLIQNKKAFQCWSIFWSHGILDTTQWEGIYVDGVFFDGLLIHGRKK